MFPIFFFFSWIGSCTFKGDDLQMMISSLLYSVYGRMSIKMPVGDISSAIIQNAAWQHFNQFTFQH